MLDTPVLKRTIGLSGAVGIGVGAIVGGGILALAGVAFSTTGSSAIVAFGLNGLIALLTALSFAQLSSSFPESGGTYTFAKKVLSVREAFLVGWVVWFASIVAAVLYALGFAAFFSIALDQLWIALSGSSSNGLTSRNTMTLLAVTATLLYTWGLVRKVGSGGAWVNIAKVVVFGVLILGGAVALTQRPASEIQSRLLPFFSRGGLGLIQAMGYTFIALQGFDLIAAVAGEIRDPERNIPRAMFMSLGIALAIYLPLLFIIATVGVESGTTITEMSAAQPETVIAAAASNYLGRFGYWLVISAAVFSMLSALQANLLAASRIALVMGRDRTLTRLFEGVSSKRGTPITAVLVTALIVVTILVVVPDVASAGAAASLIFLITFSLAHLINWIARRRRGMSSARKMPFENPATPWIGLAACSGLALFQAFAVPSAGLISAIWLGFGGVLYYSLFSRRARVVDASAEAFDPQLVRLRGKSPLVLVPIANPASAGAMISTATALAPPGTGRVLLLSVVIAPSEDVPEQWKTRILNAQMVLRQSLTASVQEQINPEALTTIATRPWNEIIRVSRLHRCESILLGFTRIEEGILGSDLEDLMTEVNSDVVVLKASEDWQLGQVKRVLVPVAGQSVHDVLRARLLASLCRISAREITYLKILSPNTAAKSVLRSKHALERLAAEETTSGVKIHVIQDDDVAGVISSYSERADLVILGLRRVGRKRKAFGEITMEIIRRTSCAIIMINRYG